jgi:hypothetical protein
MYTKTKLNLIFWKLAELFPKLAELFPKLSELFRCTGRNFFRDLATLSYLVPTQNTHTDTSSVQLLAGRVYFCSSWNKQKRRRKTMEKKHKFVLQIRFAVYLSGKFFL